MEEQELKNYDFKLGNEYDCIKLSDDIDRYYPTIERRVVELLSLHTRNAHDEIFSIYNDDANIDILKNYDKFAYMYVISQIYQHEVQAGYTSTIYDTCESIDAFKHLIEQAKFLIWRIELIPHPEDSVNLINFIKTNNLSPFFLLEIIKTASLTDEVLPRLLNIFSENNMLSFVFYILLHMDSISPGNEEILCTLAQLMLATGKKAEAASFLNRIKEPHEKTERMRQKYGL